MNIFCPKCGQLSMQVDSWSFGLFVWGIHIFGFPEGPPVECWDCYVMEHPIEKIQSEGSVFGEDDL